MPSAATEVITSMAASMASITTASPMVSTPSANLLVPRAAADLLVPTPAADPLVPLSLRPSDGRSPGHTPEFCPGDGWSPGHPPELLPGDGQSSGHPPVLHPSKDGLLVPHQSSCPLLKSPQPPYWTFALVLDGPPASHLNFFCCHPVWFFCV